MYCARQSTGCCQVILLFFNARHLFFQARHGHVVIAFVKPASDIRDYMILVMTFASSFRDAFFMITIGLLLLPLSCLLQSHFDGMLSAVSWLRGVFVGRSFSLGSFEACIRR